MVTISLSLRTGEATTLLATLKGALTDFSAPLAATRDLALASVAANFAAGGRPAPWAPLRPPRTGTPLAGRGILRTSIVSAVSPSAVLLSTALPYAGVHQFGATIQIPEIRPRRPGGVLRWTGADGTLIFRRRARAHSVMIPARTFLLLQDQDIDAILAIFTTHLVPQRP